MNQLLEMGKKNPQLTVKRIDENVESDFTHVDYTCEIRISERVRLWDGKPCDGGTAFAFS